MFRFRQSPTGRLVKGAHRDHEFWAFVPNPLPPHMEPDRELMRAVHASSYALGELAALGRNLANPHLLINPFLRREAVLSSRIEGTQASVADLYAYEAGRLSLPGLSSQPPEADVREVGNYVRALEYGLGRLETLPVSLRLIRELHGILMKGVRGEQGTPGEFRRSPNWIGRPGCTQNDAEFVPPPPVEMQAALDAFEKYLHAEESEDLPLIRLAFVHYQFEAIHPFVDGNGRIGRLLISLLLVSWNLLPLPLLYLSAYFERNRNLYYDLLMGVSEKGGWRDWVLFFLRGVAEQAEDAADRARRLEDLRIGWRKCLSQARSSSLTLALVDTLFESPVITIPRVQETLNVTYRTAQLTVGKLAEAEIVRQVGSASYGKTFIAAEILRILSEGSD
jgi:Fic family protein